MSLSYIRARFRCDGCMAWFEVELDAASERLPEDWSFFDIAVDAVRGGHIEAAQHRAAEDGFCSVQDDKHLCAKCTREEDEKHPEEEAA